MSDIKSSTLELVGKTPIVNAGRYAAKAGVTDAAILVKLEAFNPAGSVKDRIALAMIEDAEKKGILKEGATIIEPTSGNTGIGLAAVAAVKGYRAILTLPDTMSVERRNLLKAYGAELVLTEAHNRTFAEGSFNLAQCRVKGFIFFHIVLSFCNGFLFLIPTISLIFRKDNLSVIVIP